MAKENIVVGLEAGTSKVCAVVGETRVDGSIRILGIGQAPSRGVRKGEIVDFETAQKCIYEALTDAEEKSDVMIEHVYLGITGSHISSFNNRGSIEIPDDQDEITEDDCESVRLSAREVSLPSANAFIHDILQHYYVDGQDGVLNPVGLMGTRLEADFHIVHGVLTRIKNVMRCVKEIGIEIDDVIFNAYASAQVVLSAEQKNQGALAIDLGGGTLEYVLYNEGVVKQSGVLAVGGDHITNDISVGLRIPMARAEKLKLEEGSVSLGTCLPGETVFLKDDSGFAGKEIEREMLYKIVSWRVREFFDILKRRLEREPYLDRVGAGIYITGGTSQIRGLAGLVNEIFGMPVHISHAQAMSGLTSAFENPQFSTAIGLLKYAQAAHQNQPPSWWDRFKPPLPALFGRRRKSL